MSTSADTSRKMTVRTLVPFLGLTFGLTWGLAAVMILFADQVAALFGEMGYTNPLYVLAVYGPAFAAVILVARYYGFHGLGSYLRRLTLWRMSPRWWSFLVLGIPLIYYIAAAAAGTITDPFGFEPWYGVLPALLLMLVLGPMEEFGWRGVALPLL